MTEDEIRERFKITVPCCESCHEDRDHGYQMSFIEIKEREAWAGGVVMEIGSFVEVCCAVAREVRRIQEAQAEEEKKTKEKEEKVSWSTLVNRAIRAELEKHKRQRYGNADR